MRESKGRHLMRTPARGHALCLAALLLLVVASPYAAATGGRDADVTLTSDSSSKEAGPGEPAEYTITVRNTGDVDITVSLAASQEAGGCQGYSSAVEQVTAPTIPVGGTETVTLTVNVTDDPQEQTDETCDTTVTATANNAEGPGAPVQTDVTVTTTQSEGGSSSLYGVDLSTNQDTENYGGDDVVEWTVTVKNTGQAQGQQTISLEMTDAAACNSDGLSATIEPTTMQLTADEEDIATVSVSVPDGEQTEAGSHCFIARGTVTSDPNQNEQQQDNLSLTLNVPELHECDANISPTSMTLAPGASQTGTILFSNTGNSDWTVSFGKSGAKANWVTPEVSQRNLPYDNGNGQVAISFDVTPDDSMEADSTAEIRIRGLDGNDERCEQTLSVTVGQSYGVATSLSNDNLNNVEPGTSRTTQLTVTNQGNGEDSFSIGHSPVPAGWAVTLEFSSLTLQGKHAPQSERQQQVDVSVFVPIDALADEEVTITLSASSSGDSGVDSEEELSVSVAERHELSGTVLSLDQTGRSSQFILFPVTISNDGNVRDSFRLRACDPNQPSSCASPSWNTVYVDDAGAELTQISLDAGEDQQVFLRVEIQSEDEGDYLAIEMKINIVAEPSNEFSREVTARVSNYDYLMQLILAEPQGAPDVTTTTLPPGGSTTITLLLTDIGTSPYIESALFTVQGMDSTISRELHIEGVEVGIGTTPYEIGDDSTTYAVEITLTVLSGVPNGEAGVITICAASMRNTAEPSCVDVVLTVETVHDLNIAVEDGPQRNITVPEFADFRVLITNNGNVAEQIDVVSTEGLRGWTIDIDLTQFELAAGESIEILVRVKPPVELSIEDQFEFTLIVTPESAPVAAQPVDMTVNAVLDESMFGLSADTFRLMTWGVLGLIGVLIAATIFSNRRRSSEL